MDNAVVLYFNQLCAMLKRNILLKRRQKRRTIAEVLLPLYSMAVLILMKIAVPNPNFPVIDQPRGEMKLFDHFDYLTKHSIAIVPNTSYVQDFINDNVNEVWKSMNLGPELTWSYFQSREDLLTAYWLEPATIPLAVIFDGSNPLNDSFKYEIRTNPSFFETPSTTELFSSPVLCRPFSDHWTAVLPIENRENCPVNEYYYSGFVALQALLDYARIRNDSGRTDTTVPDFFLELFPKEAFTGNWMVAFRVVIPLYMVMALSQFVAYLLILIVSEKENKIKEGMKIMGLKDSVFWLSWFLIYSAFVLFLSTVCCVLLFALRVFQNTNVLLIFLLVLLYSLSIIMFGFLVTPFFDKAATAGILGNFCINILSLLYFIQVFVDATSSTAFWIVSLISSSGFALAMDKALVMDLSGEGVNFNNLWSGPGMPFGGSLIMMAFDIVLYGFLAFYLDNVIPSEHGTKRPPWFCFRLSYWCRPKVVRVPLANGNSLGSYDKTDDTNSDIEQVPREMKGREAIKIVDLHKSFQHCRKPEIKAVNGINLTIYEGQITAILGHNGAGKTTLFNILTGLTAPTSGTASVFGYDIRDADDMDQIRRMTGVCPQHDILFDNLTPKEHLEFFATVKGIPSSVRQFEVARTLKDIDLSEKADTFSKHLSGGQKRKLSVGIAVIGDPKIIILDEPTAGVDPYSRRHMWSVLQNRRHGKVILLTTHFMDEADILADRKAVISKGKLRCCGSSLFLKNKFGIGYHLTLVLDGISREHAINKLVVSHVPKAEKARRHGRELSFILPHNAVNNFAPLFSAIEQEINSGGRLGISSYGVSMTTLEEVFLHLERDEENEGSVENLSKKMVRNRALSRSLSLQSKSTSYQSLHNENNANHSDPRGMGDMQLPGLEVICEAKSPIVGLGLENIEVNPNIFQTFFALLTLRILRLIRDIQKLYFMILLPLGLAAIGLYVNSIQGTNHKMNVLSLNTWTYNGSKSNLVVYNGTEERLDDFVDALRDASAKRVTMYNGNFSQLLTMAPHMAALNINGLNVPKPNITILYNDTLQHSLPIIINMIDNTLYKLLMDSKQTEWQPIEVKVYPFQQTSQPEEFNIGVFSTSLFLGMMFILTPVSLSVDMVYDREDGLLAIDGVLFCFITIVNMHRSYGWNADVTAVEGMHMQARKTIDGSDCTNKAKNQLRVNGLSFCMYFVTYFVVLAGLLILICLALLVIILLFDIPSLRGWPALSALAMLILLHCPVSILFSTSISYIFDKTDSALSILPNIATLVGMFPFLLVFCLDVLGIGAKTAYALHVFFSLVNTMYIPYGAVYYIQRVYLMCTEFRGCTTVTLADYMTNEIIVMIVGIILQTPIWFFILMVVDIVKAGGKISDAFNIFRSNSTVRVDDMSEMSDIGENEDKDVKAERQKVKDLIDNPSQNSGVILVQNLHKEYKKNASKLCESCKTDDELKIKVAVKSLSLSIDPGEVFGLLGHNGAGKTTTMKIIIAEEAPTRGRVQIAGRNITSNLDKAFQLLGYCPQHDALWKNITVREHLECYAAIRGVRFKDIPRVVELYLSGLQIEEHASKQTQHCSGGTRRKLSFAMAMVGNPKIVLLDEPSTGMDPRSKRFLWDTILASFQGSRGAILTTHSMEEADALCSRVGIMVKGELRCLGSTQHLKNLYGAGYTLEMKLKGGDRTPTSSSMDKLKELKEFVHGSFSDASLKESFADRLVFSVPQQSVPSLANCFLELEKARTDLSIEEYSFSQTTLEQVFLRFAHFDEVSSDE